MHKIRLEKHVERAQAQPRDPARARATSSTSASRSSRATAGARAQHMVMALERFLAKHVEMNHHARLVLFLRAQNVITQLEAEEYLNPSALGAGSVRWCSRTCRRGTSCGPASSRTAIVLGVLALMLGLIHVAPLGATPQTKASRRARGRSEGFVQLNALPWARVASTARTSARRRCKAVPADRGQARDRASRTTGTRPRERSIEVTGRRRTTTQRVELDFCKDGEARAGEDRSPEGACDASR